MMRTVSKFLFFVGIFLSVGLVSNIVSADIMSDVEHGYADSNGVKVHYASLGKGPLVVMIHGFPDFWYTWRHQMEGLSEGYQVVAIDQRGYNLSDQPEGDDNYAMPNLVSDVAAVVKHLGKEKAIIVGHDWGGVVAWGVAFAMPDMVDKLIILNLPHPNGWAQLPRSAELQANTNYAQVIKRGKPSDPNILFGGPMTAVTLSFWVSDKDARKHYIKAFEQSSFDAMLAYYKINYPGVPKEEALLAPRLKMPVLVFHGLEDKWVSSDALNNTWDWIDSDLTIVTAPKAGHFVQQDAAELVTSTMKWWLKARP